MQSDDAMSRSVSSKSILRVESFLNMTSVDAKLQSSLFLKTCFVERGVNAPKERDLQATCSVGREMHQCLEPFKEQPGIVKKLC